MKAYVVWETVTQPMRIRIVRQDVSVGQPKYLLELSLRCDAMNEPSWEPADFWRDKDGWEEEEPGRLQLVFEAMAKEIDKRRPTPADILGKLP